VTYSYAGTTFTGPDRVRRHPDGRRAGVAYFAPRARAGSQAVPVAAVGSLPTRGFPPAVAVTALGLLGAALVVRRLQRPSHAG
jgi:hypothetical protein